MIQIECSCGKAVEIPYDAVGERASCPHCQRPMRVVGDAATGEPSAHGSRLVVCEGPDDVGEQLFLLGPGPIGIGKSPGNAILIRGEHVAPNHCRLVREGDAWRVEDLRSQAGVFVNGNRAAGQELQTGDVLQVGDYELEFTAGREPSGLAAASSAVGSADDLYELAPEPAAPRPKPRRAVQTFDAPPPTQLAGGVVCPSCQRSLPFGSRICVDCGIDLQTGRALLTAREVDENALYVHTETAVRAISWILPLGVYPVSSEGFGSRKPYVIWAIAALTALVSLAFWIGNFNTPAAQRSDLPLMLWAGTERPYPADTGPDLESLGTTDLAPVGEFHVWQLLTYAFLHGGILHLTGNMLFLIVFGTRVNALIGPLKTAILYPLLAIAAALVYLWAEAAGPLRPMIGASGAIMGLAGMYLVLFPVHRVHTVAWIRLGLMTGFRLSMNIFAIRGFWVVLFYIAFDVLATLIGSRDGVAHWAHLGGFGAGMAAALVLLLTRQVDARGGDILSAILGRRAWALIGKPASRAA